MKIAVDCDGTILKLTDGLCGLFEYKHKRKFDPLTFRDWEWFRHEGIKKEDFYQACLFFGKGTNYRALAPYDQHVARVVKALAATHELYILTGMAEERVAGLESWLEEAGIWDCFTTVLTSGPNPEDKLNFDFDLLVDDCPLLVRPFMVKGETRRLALMHAPWNRGVREMAATAPNIHVTDGWLGLEELIYDYEANGLA